MRSGYRWQKKYWVASTSLYFPRIDKGHIHNHLILMRSASPTTSTTILTSTAITRCAEPVTGCAASTACPWLSQVRTRARATSSIISGRTERHQLQGRAESHHRPADPRILHPERSACLVAAERIRDQARKVHLRQSAGSGSAYPSQNLIRCRLHGRSRCLPHCRSPSHFQATPQRIGKVSLLIDIQIFRTISKS